MISIHNLTLADLPGLKTLQPENWPDIIPYFEFYLASPFCTPVMAMHQNMIAGVGSAIKHNETGWLAHIIVHAEKRNLGIGKYITESLVNILENHHCKTLLLIATALGEPVYTKVGFESEMKYLFFRNGTADKTLTGNVLSYAPQHKISVLNLDRRISGEDRAQLLSSHLAGSKLVMNGNTVRGCYFTTLGEGLIIADDNDAGIILLNHRHETLAKTAVPETNTGGIKFLEQQGFEHFLTGTRMWKGEKLNWQSEKVYSRIGGNLG